MSSPTYAQDLGLPAGNSSSVPDWVAGATPNDDAGMLSFGPAPGIESNPGGAPEVTMCPSDERLDWFHMPDKPFEGLPGNDGPDPILRNADPPNGWKPDPETWAELPDGPIGAEPGEPMEPAGEGPGSAAAGTEASAEAAEEEELLELLLEGLGL